MKSELDIFLSELSDLGNKVAHYSECRLSAMKDGYIIEIKGEFMRVHPGSFEFEQVHKVFSRHMSDNEHRLEEMERKYMSLIEVIRA